jgi:hypothetical protein
MAEPLAMRGEDIHVHRGVECLDVTAIAEEPNATCLGATDQRRGQGTALSGSSGPTTRSRAGFP